MNKLLLLERGIAFCFRLRRTQLSFDFWFFLLVFTFDDCTLVYLSVSTYRLDLFSWRDQVSRTLLYLLLLDFSARDDWHVTWLASRKTPPPRLLLLLFSRVAVGKKKLFLSLSFSLWLAVFSFVWLFFLTDVWWINRVVVAYRKMCPSDMESGHFCRLLFLPLFIWSNHCRWFLETVK